MIGGGGMVPRIGTFAMIIGDGNTTATGIIAHNVRPRDAAEGHQRKSRNESFGFCGTRFNDSTIYRFIVPPP